MKKVLCMTRKYPPSVGGMERFCYDLYSRLEQDAEMDVDVVALGKKQIHLIWFFPYCMIYLLFNAKKYDVILFSDALFAGCAWLAGLVSPKTRKVTDIHGLDITYGKSIYRLYMKLFLDKFDIYVCNSKNTERLVRERGLKNTVVINRGVNVEQQNNYCLDKSFKQKYDIPDDYAVMITVGRLVRRKGVEWFVSNVMPELDHVFYLIVGGGPDKENVEKAIEKNELSHCVKMLGKVSDEELEALYYNADIFVMPNIPVENDVEGFGIVAIEASYKKCIVVASDIDGIADAVVDGENGFLVECKNVKGFVDKIQDYTSNKEEYGEIRVRFSDYTKNNYSMRVIAEKYKEIIR